MKDKLTSIVWFRRDLRLYDHIPLSKALKLPGYIQPIFIFDTDILNRFTNKEDKRMSFIAEALCELESNISKKVGKLLVFYGSARKIVPQIAINLQVKSIFAGKDYEPYGKERDEDITNYLKPYGINLILHNDHLIITPEEMCRSDGNPYKVFTPYFQRWHKVLQGRHLEHYEIADDGRYLNIEKTGANLGIKPLESTKGPEFLLRQIGYKYSPLPNWSVKLSTMYFNNFMNYKIQTYKINRDFMGIDGTSKLSPYIRFGLISIRECYKRALEKKEHDSWVKELIWRDFYASILYYYPNTTKEEFLPQFRSLNWKNNQEYLVKWQQGLTGFPIVDAAMRQLNQEGWMHNRSRMIVASFLTKNLLLDWRLGEEYFAQLLMDYELSSNVGGWQWAASTGTDAQPYFRIFNPTLQGQKFDQDGIYIKKYIPELKNVPQKYIHQPLQYPNTYPTPIVNHIEARKRALRFYQSLSAI
jgi:deoxyribodipyrimidine photo-lyase